MAFLTAAELNKRFLAKGAFYRLKGKEDYYLCRGLATINRKEDKITHANALIVMVNPGSCTPADREYSVSDYPGKLRDIPLVEAKPDPTQYQIMRLMERQGWSSVHMINLSDLCSGRLNEFKKTLRIFDDNQNNLHSIFSENRRTDILSLLSKDTRIIAGWGVKPFLHKRILEAYAILCGHAPVHGVLNDNFPYYLHPFPMTKEKCIKWLEDMCAVLE
ncbi:ABC-type proline/glycine betaine transport systems, periplasmic components [Bacillus sp. OxB-1]|uniref:DUF1643 domain-containing protein n=1 Tax=Bacillus sp. (strain OxB-1) TaxID=98228 RepID=UPI000581BA2B|nr:DUF1643 domain-containing protein [Bacillus sp. OxB-1]BAQ10009.1 ABC-type proline/glycine betaine transport systems, periplasmic components [Bacillus sp. OxB-1]